MDVQVNCSLIAPCSKIYNEFGRVNNALFPDFKTIKKQQQRNKSQAQIC